MSAAQPTPGPALADDPWQADYPARIALARSCLGHADQTCWRQQIDRALAALEGRTITELMEEGR